MLGPLAQRQIHLVSNVEAMRQALDAGDQQTRELSRKRAADDRQAEAGKEVPQIPKAEALRTEERQSRQQRNAPGRPASSDEEAPEEGSPEAGASANAADSHLDFLA